jgi:hypothetical protein
MQRECIGPLAYTHSGGGMTSLTGAIGISRAMVLAGNAAQDGPGGLLARVDYIGSISGGNWFSSLLACEARGSHRYRCKRAM